MDPNVTIERMRKLVAEIRRMVDAIEESDLTALDCEAANLADYVDALDEWLTRGGSLPADWKCKLYKCCDPLCPGYPYRANEVRHDKCSA